MAGGPAASSRLAGERVLQLNRWPLSCCGWRQQGLCTPCSRSTLKWHPQVAIAATLVGLRAMHPIPVTACHEPQPIPFAMQGGGDAHGGVHPGHLLNTHQAHGRQNAAQPAGCSTATPAALLPLRLKAQLGSPRPPCPLPATHPVPEVPWRGQQACSGTRQSPFIRTAPGWGRAPGFPAGRTAAPGVPQNRL